MYACSFYMYLSQQIRSLMIIYKYKRTFSRIFVAVLFIAGTVLGKKSCDLN